MENVINYVKENWGAISLGLGWIISEILAMNPKCKANGILHLILNLLKKTSPNNVNTTPEVK